MRIHYTTDGKRPYCHRTGSLDDTLATERAAVTCEHCERLLEHREVGGYGSAYLESEKPVRWYVAMAGALGWGLCAGILAWCVLPLKSAILVGTLVAAVLWIKACKQAIKEG